jgi:peptidoglycan hydrolase CwlO-like protein
MRKTKTLKTVAMVLTFAVMFSLTVTADPTASRPEIRRGLVTGDVIARSRAGENPGIGDALAILRSLVGLSGDVRDNRQIDLSSLVGGSTPSNSDCLECPRLSSSITQLNSDLAQANSDRSEAITARDFWQGQFNTANGTIQQLTQQRDSFQSQANTAVGQLDILNGVILDLQGQLADAIRERDTLRNTPPPPCQTCGTVTQCQQCQTYLGQLTERDGQISNLNQRISELTGQLGAPTEQITELNNIITSLNEQIGTLTTERNEAQQALGAAIGQRDFANQRITELQAQIDNHVCPPTGTQQPCPVCTATPSADVLGPSSGAIPPHLPAPDRSRITNPAQNVVHLEARPWQGIPRVSRPSSDESPLVNESGHFVRFNEVAENIGDPPISQYRLHIRRGGTYVIKGELINGSIFINAFDRPHRTASEEAVARGERTAPEPRFQEPVVLILEGLTISNNDGPAIHVRRASNVTIVLQDGTTNRLTDSATYMAAFDPDDDDAPPEPGAVIFSQVDLIFTGRGALEINGRLSEQRWRRTGGPQGTATAMIPIQGRGIESRDFVHLRGGNITVNALDTAVQGRDGVTVSGGTFNLNSANNNGIRSNNATTSNAAVDNNTLGNIIISNGEINIRVGSRGDAISAERNQRVTGGSINAVNTEAGAGD